MVKILSKIVKLTLPYTNVLPYGTKKPTYGKTRAVYGKSLSLMYLLKFWKSIYITIEDNVAELGVTKKKIHSTDPILRT